MDHALNHAEAIAPTDLFGPALQQNIGTVLLNRFLANPLDQRQVINLLK